MHSKHLLCLVLMSMVLLGCPQGDSDKPLHRERAKERDSGCTDPKLPSAYFYPAEDRTHYKPDHPHRDGCQMLVPDHLFCCPNSPRRTDR